ncbi:NXPE family member 4-like [Dreissena polymorpha]|nr:NXPE family member 4-like [Dreissena polymorpha]
MKKPLCKQMRKGLTWENITNNINGFWLNNTWSLLNCKLYIEHQTNTYRNCLKGKHMYFFGDSIVRQYAEFFTNVVLETRPDINLQVFGKNNTYHWRETFSNFDINVTYLKHAMPFYNPVVPIRGITSVYSELQILSRSSIPGDKLIFLFSFHAHFQSFPISVIRDRIRRLVKSIRAFLILKPKALFFVKGPNYCFDDTHWFDNTLTMVYIEILQQEFESLHDRVVYLDTWSLNVVLETRNIHPGPVTLQNQIRHFMAYVC